MKVKRGSAPRQLFKLLCVAFPPGMPRRCGLLSCLLGVLVLCTTAHAQDEQRGRFDSVRREYFSLARKDPAVAERDEWIKIESELDAVLADNPAKDFYPKALFLSARINEQIYRAHRDRAALEKSMAQYRDFSEDFVPDTLADDALLALGELQRTELKDIAAAKISYSKLLDRYPKSDLVAVAKERLAQLPKAAGGKKSAGETKSTGKQGAAAPGAGAGSASGAVPPPTTEAAADVPPGATPQPASTAKPAKSGFFSWFDGASSEPEETPTPEASKHPLADKVKKELVIVIDPGHGGEEEGAVGVDHVLEKEVVLSISRELEALLQQRLGVKVVLTRTEDVTLPLAERTKIANESKADLFISVHTNASKNKSASGIETYYLDTTNDKASLKLAERENASVVNDGTDLGFIVSDLIQNAKLADSIALAHKLQEALVKRIRSSYADAKNLGVKKAPFYVLVGAHMPCVLLEVSFIDHKVEGQRLISREYQHLIALAVFDGITAYLETRPELLQPS